jgi:hypothetical protein
MKIRVYRGELVKMLQIRWFVLKTALDISVHAVVSSASSATVITYNDKMFMKLVPGDLRQGHIL